MQAPASGGGNGGGAWMGSPGLWMGSSTVFLLFFSI
jgi:hypothetical protein